MKKIFILTNLFLIIFVTSNAQQDLLSNGDFETWVSGGISSNGLRPDDWTATFYEQESGIKHSENFAVKITAGNSPNAYLNQQISLTSYFEAGATYEMRIWYYVVSHGQDGDIIINSKLTNPPNDAVEIDETFSANTTG
ncbi:MAG: carbohydrate binding domain-containing protein, partial [Prevotellaceae bacterium]|nr:carbohydrate binding domain-containing protein [Prevotellaceae bacterium]